MLSKLFDVSDALLVSRLQSQGILLDPEEALTQTYRPLLAALMGCLPLQRTGILTYVCTERGKNQRMAGFAQVRMRRGRPEADVIYLSPAPSVAQEATAIWGHLLENLCFEAGKQGVQRIFARPPEDGPEAEVFQQAGFSIYAREDIFRLERAPNRLPQPEGRTMRPQQAVDNWRLQELYATIAPHLVQQTESLASKWETSPGSWLLPAKREGYVLEDKGEILGYVQIREGQVGHWLEMLLHPEAYDMADELVTQALALLARFPLLPIYCCLRRYQGGLTAALKAKGFQLFASRCVMVKHTTVRIKEPALKLVPSLEKGAEAATPMMNKTLSQGDSRGYASIQGYR